MPTTVITIRAEDVALGDIERHVSGQGRLMPWRRVVAIRKEGLFVAFTYEGGDTLGSSTRALNLVEVQRDA